VDRFSVRPPRASDAGSSPVQSVQGTASISQQVADDSRRRRKSVDSVHALRASTTSSQPGCCGCCPSCATFLFVVVGALLIIVGVTRIFISFWHEFGSSVWTGALASQL